MIRKSLLIIVIVLIVALLIFNFSLLNKPKIEKFPDFFVGVDVAYADLVSIKNLVDQVSSYTNTFVIGSTGITANLTILDEICQYLYDRGMYFILYIIRWDVSYSLSDLEAYERRWGDRLLGFYIHDEIGGAQMDLNEYRWVFEADNYTDAAIQFVNRTTRLLNRSYGEIADSTFFTSDYTLYWFDYKSGFDVVFAEFGWNYSRQLNVALDRGAATVQNKDWGVMITWTYNHLPYIESGEELYEDMILAYNNGAKYILIFDTNKNYTEGILKQEHLEAIEQFWHYANNNPRTCEVSSERVAYVLPKDYGYGFRGPNDKIWGLWEADVLSFDISQQVNNLLEEHGQKLDIIYDDDIKYDEFYSKYIFWNGTIILN